MRMPGPMVELTPTRRKYRPFAEAGRTRCSSSTMAQKFALEGGGLEAGLADGNVDVAVAVGAVLDLATLELLDGFGHVGGHGAGLGVGMATGAEHTAQLADRGHHVWAGDGDVEVG